MDTVCFQVKNINYILETKGYEIIFEICFPAI